MEVCFDDEELDQLETDPTFTMGLSPALVKSYRKKMQIVHSAADERDLRAMSSLHMEKLKGTREGDYSFRLNDQYRVIFRLEGSGTAKRVRIIGIEDYH